MGKLSRGGPESGPVRPAQFTAQILFRIGISRHGRFSNGLTPTRDHVRKQNASNWRLESPRRREASQTRPSTLTRKQNSNATKTGSAKGLLL